MTGKTHLAGGLAAGLALPVLVDSIPMLSDMLQPSVSIAGILVPSLLPGVAVSVAAALLPDIDEPESLIVNTPDAARKQLKRGKQGFDRATRTLMGAILSVLQFIFKGLAYLVRILAGGHRGATHMLLITAGLSVGMYALGRVIGFESLWMWFAAGYLSHLLLDMMTPSGLEFLWPLLRRPIHILPRPLCITTGTAGDSVMRILLLAVSAWLLYLQFARNM